MTDCDDTDDSPDGSIEDIREDFLSAADAFRNQAQENLAKRQAGDPVAQRSGTEPEGPGADGKQPPFNPNPILLAPHFTGSEKRPIPQRRQLYDGSSLAGKRKLRVSNAGWKENHPFESDSLEVEAPTVSYSDDSPDFEYEGKIITAGQDYTVDCTIRNVGGLPARNVTVELYVEHLEPRARLDINEQTGYFEVNQTYDGHGEATLTFGLSGTTTMAPLSNIVAIFHKGDSVEPPYPGLLWTDPFLTPSGARNIYSATTEVRSDDPILSEETTFNIDLWDWTRITFIEDDLFEELPERGIHLGQQEGRLVDRNPLPDRTVHDHDLMGSVSMSPDEGPTKRIGKQYTSIPQNGERTVTFQYTPDQNEFPNADLPNSAVRLRGEGRGMTVFYFRAYSLADDELPEDWSGLDHTQSRFMGRTEVRREVPET